MVFYILKLMAHWGLLDGKFKGKNQKEYLSGEYKILEINYKFYE
jgi:hypothetical protein